MHALFLYRCVLAITLSLSSCWSVLADQLVVEDAPSKLTAGPFDDTVNFVCKVKYDGTGNCLIKDVVTSCSCEKANLSKLALASEEEATLQVTVKPPSSASPAASSVIIEPVTSQVKPLAVDFLVTKVALIDYDTRLLVWKPSEGATQKEINFRLCKEARIKEISANDDSFSFQLKRGAVLDSQGAYTLLIKSSKHNHSHTTCITMCLVGTGSASGKAENIVFYAVTI